MHTEHHMKMKAEAGVVYLQDKERQSSHITLEARREDWTRPSLLVLRQNSSAVPFVQTEAAALRQRLLLQPSVCSTLQWFYQ